MKFSALIAMLFIGGVIFYVTGGGALLGLGGSGHLPDTTEPAARTFMGNEQDNPFIDQGPAH